MGQMQLLQKRKFLPLFLTQFLGAFNDNFLRNSLTILITYSTTEIMGLPPAQLVPAAAALFMLPFFLFSALAGQIADKYEKSRLIRWIKVLEVVIMTIALIGLTIQSVPFLLVVLFLMGFQSAVFGPIKYSILPQHLGEDDIVGGNALVETGTFLAILLGTIAGGVLITRPQGAYLVGGLLVVFATLGWFASHKIPNAPSAAPDLKVRWNPITPTWDILKFTYKFPSVYRSILGISWFWLFGSVLLSLFPTYCKDFLHANGT